MFLFFVLLFTRLNAKPMRRRRLEEESLNCAQMHTAAENRASEKPGARRTSGLQNCGQPVRGRQIEIVLRIGLDTMRGQRFDRGCRSPVELCSSSCWCDSLIAQQQSRNVRAKDRVRISIEQMNSSQKLLASPVLVPAIGKISANNQGNLLFAEFLDGDLKGISFTLDVDENGSVHAVTYCQPSSSLLCELLSFRYP